MCSYRTSLPWHCMTTWEGDYDKGTNDNKRLVLEYDKRRPEFCDMCKAWNNVKVNTYHSRIYYSHPDLDDPYCDVFTVTGGVGATGIICNQQKAGDLGTYASLNRATAVYMSLNEYHQHLSCKPDALPVMGGFRVIHCARRMIVMALRTAITWSYLMCGERITAYEMRLHTHGL